MLQLGLQNIGHNTIVATSYHSSIHFRIFRKIMESTTNLDQIKKIQAVETTTERRLRDELQASQQAARDMERQMVTSKVELGEKESELQSVHRQREEAYRALQKNYQAVHHEKRTWNGAWRNTNS